MSMVRDRVAPVTGSPGGAHRPRHVVENKAFAAFAGRIVRAFSRRVAAGDVEALPDLVGFSRLVDEQIAAAVLGLREFGYGWDEIASRLGVSKDAVCARWAKKLDPHGGQEFLPTLHGAGDRL